MKKQLTKDIIETIKSLGLDPLYVITIIFWIFNVLMIKNWKKYSFRKNLF